MAWLAMLTCAGKKSVISSCVATQTFQAIVNESVRHSRHTSNLTMMMKIVMAMTIMMKTKTMRGFNNLKNLKELLFLINYSQLEVSNIVYLSL